ncbi:hypothetical protein CAEBREN_31659, partial [Caenorhabditis brenneri]
MGRKNKTKLLKNFLLQHGSQSLNASTIGESDARISSSEKVPEFEVLSSHLRELVNASPSTTDRNREVKYMFAALEKRDAELLVARQLIRKLQEGALSEHNGDGDSSIVVHDETYSDAQLNNNEELDRAKKYNEELILERETLASQLGETEECVNRLQGIFQFTSPDIKRLENDQEQTCRSLEESRKTSSEIIQELNKSLEAAKVRADDLESQLKSRQAAYLEAVKDLNILKEACSTHDRLLEKNVELKNDTASKLEKALADLASSKEEVSTLLTSVEELQNDRATTLQQLVSDREKLESRYERINNGVQMIKKDFCEVKKSLIDMTEQKKELSQKLVASKADVKHYREDGDACRNYIKKLEEKLLNSENLQSTISDLQKDFREAQEKLLITTNEVTSYESLMANLSAELQEELQSANTTSLLDAVRKLKDEFRVEQRKQVFNSAALEAKDAAHQKLVQQNEKLLEEIAKNEFLRKDEVRLFEEEKNQLNGELASAKSFAKKIRKEKDSALRKLKRLLLENSELAKQSKSQEDELDNSVHSNGNDSILSQSSESMAALEESITSLKESLASSEEKLKDVAKQLIDKENENLDLQRTVLTFESKMEENEQDNVNKEKTIAMMESRLSELQRSADGLQKRYDEETSTLHQKLHTTEDKLKAIEESKSLVLSDSEKLKLVLESERTELQEEITQLKNAILLHQSNESQNEELIALAEKEKAKLFEECKTLKAQFDSVRNELTEQEESNELIKSEILQLTEALNVSENEKKESLEELSKLTSKVVESERSQSEKEAELAALNSKLQGEVDDLKTQIMNQDMEIEKLSTNITVSNQALEELTKASNQKFNDYEKTLHSEKAKCEILSKKLEEKTAESSDRLTRLKFKEDNFEKMKVEFEKDSLVMKQKIDHLETEVARAVSERNAINTEVDGFKVLVAEKEANVEKLSAAKADLDLKQELLEKEIEIVSKKLEEAVSPKKDKILQLENRLEVMQTASHARCKRLEEELSSAIASLEQSAADNRYLEEQISELQQKSILVDELSANNEIINEELAKSVELRTAVAELEKQNNDIQLENAEERASLVNELIDAKQKLMECEKLILVLQDESKAKTSNGTSEEEEGEQ